MTIIICDSSLLILLSKLEMLDLLIEAFDNVIIPQAVYSEAVTLGKILKKMDAFLIEKQVKDKKINLKQIKDIAEKENLIKNFNIHDGEAEAIVLYIEEKADLLGTDDYKTLKVCKILEIKYFTTLLFIIRCFSNNKLSKDSTLLKFENLKEIGWYKENNIIDYMNKIEKEEV